MKKVLKKILSVLIVGALIATSIVGFSVTSFATSDLSEEGPHVPFTYYVRTESELRNALYNSLSGDTVMLLNNIIVTGERCLYLCNSIKVDFNYNCLTFGDKCCGVQINSSVNLCNGTIYGNNDTDYTIWIYGGSPKISNCSMYDGSCGDAEIAYGNAIYCNAHSSKIYLDYVYLQGGSGYTIGIFTPERTGKAIYLDWSGSKVYSVGRGYTYVDGQANQY